MARQLVMKAKCSWRSPGRCLVTTQRREGGDCRGGLQVTTRTEGLEADLKAKGLSEMIAKEESAAAAYESRP